MGGRHGPPPLTMAHIDRYLARHDGTNGRLVTTPSEDRGFLHHLGSLPLDASESATFVRSRVAMLTGFIVFIAGPLWLINAALNAVFFPGFEPGRISSPRSIVHGLGVLLIGAIWLTARRSGVAVSWARRADWAALMLLGAVVGGMVLLSDPAYRPELVMSLALSHFLVLRAAVVPSTWKTTAALGSLSELPLVGAAWYTHRYGAAGAISPASAAAAASVWALLTVSVTSLISFVIYGLHRRVRDAMQLGQYVLETKLGEGGMGVVYRARHAMLRRPTAVKLLLPGRTEERSILRFEREVQLTASLSHPNIIAVHDFGRTAEGIFYYAMEYIEGLDLEALVRVDGPQPAGRVRHILRQVAGALAEAHAVGLIHRDVKPANVMLSEGTLDKDRVKLLDFGLVKDTSDRHPGMTDTRTLKGTPLYASPEAIRSPQDIDARSDIYSFGAMGYYLLTGVPVFDGESVVEVCAQHVHKAPVPPSERLGVAVPASLEGLLLRCLRKSPNERPQTAGEVVAALEGSDDGVRWTMQEAARWWVERAPAVREAAATPTEPSPRPERNMAVDFRKRH